METNTKSIFKSKLFYLGLLNVIIGVLHYIAGNLESGTAITIDGILIIILRALTKQGVRLK